jgi:hypothetical protein
LQEGEKKMDEENEKMQLMVNVYNDVSYFITRKKYSSDAVYLLLQAGLSHLFMTENKEKFNEYAENIIICISTLKEMKEKENG